MSYAIDHIECMECGASLPVCPTCGGYGGWVEDEMALILEYIACPQCHGDGTLPHPWRPERDEIEQALNSWDELPTILNQEEEDGDGAEIESREPGIWGEP